VSDKLGETGMLQVRSNTKAPRSLWTR